MSKTTKGMAPADVLITVGQWIKEGYEIEASMEGREWHKPMLGVVSVNISGKRILEYRPKPKKPKKPQISWVFETWFDSNAARPPSSNTKEVVELTPEVHAVLEREGLL